jgi:hypothetical protein
MLKTGLGRSDGPVLLLVLFARSIFLGQTKPETVKEFPLRKSDEMRTGDRQEVVERSFVDQGLA